MPAAKRRRSQLNNHIKAEIGLGMAIVLCLVFIAWDQYHKSLANAVAEQTAEIKKQAQKQIDDSLSTRDRQYQQDRQDLEAKYEALRKMTPQQIVIKAPEYVPGLQGKPPLQIVGPETQGVPIGSAIVPPESIQPLAQAILDGQKCGLDLAKCQGDLKDWAGPGGKFDLKDQEAKEWEKAAKGGSWLKRLGKNALKIGIGVGIGYAVAHR